MSFAIRALLFIALSAANAVNAGASEQSTAAMRGAFLQAEQYITQDRDADYFAVADSLKSYPLYPYLTYQWLKKHLDDTNAILSFERDHPDSVYTPLLHRKWLAWLGNNQQWLTFLGHYRSDNDSELQCYYALAQYRIGQQETALDSATQLWISGKTYPSPCDNLFSLLQASSRFNPDLVWRRFRAALAADNDRIAESLLALLPGQDRPVAEIWLKLHRQPQRVENPAGWKNSYPQAGVLFAHAITRWLENEPAQALSVWDTEKSKFAIPPDIAADTEKRLAMALAFRHDSRAYARLSQLVSSDAGAREWRVRAAISRQNWPEANTALAALSEEEKQQDKWQYWQARALAATGQTEQANGIFQQLAKNRSLYGFLAADKLQQAISLTDQPVVVSAADIDRLQQRTEFRIVAELLAIGRKLEAKRQWRHAIRDFDHNDLLVAAKLAQQWQWPAMAITTIARTNHWDDMGLRYPLPYNAPIHDAANAEKLDPALIYGLIRQESLFDELADSSAGAKGLMQLMPKTARELAEITKDGWNEKSLFNPQINIKYGSFYYKKLLQQFKGNHLLATAAYNAGANKVKRWLPVDKPLPGDIWMEAIPYKETRNYVAAVLMNALIYQQRLQRKSFKPADLLGEILPG